MTIGTEPGLEIFSDKWMNVVASGIPVEYHPVILDLCKSYGLGNSSDPWIVYEILKKHGTVKEER